VFQALGGAPFPRFSLPKVFWQTGPGLFFSANHLPGDQSGLFHLPGETKSLQLWVLKLPQTILLLWGAPRSNPFPGPLSRFFLTPPNPHLLWGVFPFCLGSKLCLTPHKTGGGPGLSLLSLIFYPRIFVNGVLCVCRFFWGALFLYMGFDKPILPRFQPIEPSCSFSPQVFRNKDFVV